MDWVAWMYAICAAASAIAAVLAWAAKLRWSKEFGAAKDETIKSKETQIETLRNALRSLGTLQDEVIKAKDAQIESLHHEIENIRELTPMKIREYFLSVKAQLEEFNDCLQQQLHDARAELDAKCARIQQLRLNGHSQSADVEKILADKRELEEKLQSLESLRKKYEWQQYYAEISKIPLLDINHLNTLGAPQFFEELNKLSSRHQAPRRPGAN